MPIQVPLSTESLCKIVIVSSCVVLVRVLVLVLVPRNRIFVIVLDQFVFSGRTTSKPTSFPPVVHLSGVSVALERAHLSSSGRLVR
jgi:hypothetical protein